MTCERAESGEKVRAVPGFRLYSFSGIAVQNALSLRQTLQGMKDPKIELNKYQRTIEFLMLSFIVVTLLAIFLKVLIL
jgi:hypothetical protein